MNPLKILDSGRPVREFVLVRAVSRIHLALALAAALALAPAACVSVECDGADAFCDPFALILYQLNVDPDCMVRGQTLAAGWAFFSGSVAEDEFVGAICGLRDGTLMLGAETNDADPAAQGQPPLVPFGGVANNINITVYQSNGLGAIRRWTNFGGAGVSHGATRIAGAPDGGVFVVGFADGLVPGYQGLSPLQTHAGGTDLVLLRFDAQLQPLWYTYIGGTGNDTPTDIAPTADGGVVILARSSAAFTIQGRAPLQPYVGGSELLLMHVLSSGSVDWFSFFGGAGNDTAVGLKRVPSEPLFAGQSAANDSFAIAGIVVQDIPAYAGRSPVRAYSGGSDIVYLRFDRTGSVSQYGFYGTAGNETAQTLQVMRSGDIFLGGGSTADIPVFDGLAPLNPFAGGASDAWLVRLNAAGVVQSHRFPGSTLTDSMGALTESSSGDLFAALGLGATTNIGITPVYANGGASDAALLRIDSNDIIQAFANYGGTAGEVPFAIAPTEDGGAVLGGEAPAPGFSPPAGTTLLEAHTGGSSDEFYLRVFADGRLTR